MSDAPSAPSQPQPLEDVEDFYYEGELIVFTAKLSPSSRILLSERLPSLSLLAFSSKSEVRELAGGLLFDYGKDLVGVDGRSFSYANLNHAAGLWRLDFVLHLHRFDYYDALTLCYFIARGKQHSYDFSRHRRDQILPAFDAVLDG